MDNWIYFSCWVAFVVLFLSKQMVYRDITHKTELSSFLVRYSRIRGVTYIAEFIIQNLSALTHVALIFYFLSFFFPLKWRKSTKQPYECLILSMLAGLSQRSDVLSRILSTVRIPEPLILITQMKKEVVQKCFVCYINYVVL